MLKSLIFGMLFLTLGLPPAIASAAALDYSMGIRLVGATPVATIELRFVGDRSGETTIVLPDHWAGSKELWRNIGGPTITGGAFLASDKPDRWRIRHSPGAPLILRYEVSRPRSGPPDVDHDEKALPVLQPAWFLIHGEGAIVIPEGRDTSAARFAWRAVPKGWPRASDLDTPPAGLTAEQVASGIFIGGPQVAIRTLHVGPAPVRVASVGRWTFDTRLFADRIATLMRAENLMLGAPAIPYLVTLTPIADGGRTGAMSSGGTGRTAGFAMTSTDNVPLADLTRTMAHEYAHRWFGRGFGPNTDGARPYLFSEGFNDWFAARAMVISGLWSASDWIDGLNLVLLRYGSSTARNLSEDEITRRFWDDPDAMQLQYDRGNLTALLLDRRLRAANRGLLPLLRQMIGGTTEERDHIGQLADRALPGAFDGTVRDALGPLPEDTIGACGMLRWIEQPLYGRGFDIDDVRKVSTVVPGSGAEKAGFRPGMVYRRRISFRHLDSTVPIVGEFEDGGMLRTVRWMPSLPGIVRFQRLDKSAVGTPACHALLWGQGVE